VVRAGGVVCGDGLTSGGGPGSGGGRRERATSLRAAFRIVATLGVDHLIFVPNRSAIQSSPIWRPSAMIAS
jgi:hypothetical protein